MNDVWANFGSAALGALLGSLSAFWLGVRQQRTDQRRKEHAALLRAQYALASQWNILKSIEKSFLAPHRDNPTRHMNLAEFHSFSSEARVPFEDIAFIAHSDEPNLLQEIHIAEQKFESAKGALSLRNERISKLDQHPGVEVLSFDIETGQSKIAAPAKELFMMRQATNNLYELIDEAIPKLLGEMQALETFIKRRYRGMKAIRYQPE
jgi:hypothetical protein